MNKDFDELYNEFFGGKGKDDDDEMKRAKKLIENLNNFDDADIDGFNPYENELGEADEVHTFIENGYTFKKSTWNLEEGQVVKVEMTSSPMDIGFTPKKKLTLEEKLSLAIENEEYEEAAILRDNINLKKR